MGRSKDEAGTIGRRPWLAGTAALGASGLQPAPVHAETGFAALGAAFAGIERAGGGRLGVAVLDAAGGRAASHRGAERFPMASTFKLFVAGAVLARADRGEERLDRRIHYAQPDLVPWSPVTDSPAGLRDGLPVAALVEAMMTASDNTATNLLLRLIGGPEGLTAFLRERLGDAVTRSDREEPAMSEGRPGDGRDTTSPLAFLGSMRALLLGDALSEAARQRLLLLMKANQTGATLLRARLPPGWQVGDRTGAAGHRTRNVVGLVWPARRTEPVLVAAFLAEGPERPEGRDAVLAEVGAAIYGALAA
jgi:beta-lactamase class A